MAEGLREGDEWPGFREMLHARQKRTEEEEERERRRERDKPIKAKLVIREVEVIVKEKMIYTCL